MWAKLHSLSLVCDPELNAMLRAYLHVLVSLCNSYWLVSPDISFGKDLVFVLGGSKPSQDISPISFQADDTGSFKYPITSTPFVFTKIAFTVRPTQALYINKDYIHFFFQFFLFCFFSYYILWI